MVSSRGMAEVIDRQLSGMLSRPHMFCQNAGSFEDQFMLLLDLRICLRDEGLLNNLRDDFEVYRRSIMKRHTMPLALEYTFDTIPTIDRVLSVFYEEIKRRYEF